MIVCRKCSRRYPDRTEFCSCGAYLPFDGEHVADPVPPAQEATKANVPVTQPPSPPAEAGPSQSARWSAFSGDTASRRESSEEGGVDARLPDVPTQHGTSEAVWIEPSGRVGDVACRYCSTPNAPALQFCRHCGQPVHGPLSAETAAAADGRTPWWRRLGRRVRQQAGPVDAARLASSARRVSAGGVNVRTLMFRGGMVAVVALGFLAFLGPFRRTLSAGAKDLLGGERFDEVDQVTVQVTSVPVQPGRAPKSSGQRIPANLNDGFANTTWATRWIAEGEPGTLAPPTDGECVVGARTDSALRFTFKEPTDLANIAILGGRHAEDKSAGPFSRPLLIELEVGGECDHIQLRSEGELEIAGFSHDNVDVVDLRVVDIVADPEQSTSVEIAEVVFGEE